MAVGNNTTILGPLGTAALAYAARGWHVFPLRPHDKRPLGGVKTPLVCAGHTFAHGFKDATTDADVIRACWLANPSANIGISTGPSGLVVIDVDVKDGKQGAASFRRLEALYDLGEIVTVTTPSGGAHYYFSYADADIGSGNGLPNYPGIDIRGFDGFVVAGPSHLSKNEKLSYVEGFYKDASTLEVPGLPAGFAALLLSLAPRAGVQVEPISSGIAVATDPEVLLAALRISDETRQRIVQGLLGGGDRSAEVARLADILINAGAEDDEIVCLFLHQPFGVSESILEKGSPEKWLRDDLARLRSSLIADSPKKGPKPKPVKATLNTSGFPHNDAGNALLFARLSEGNLRYVYESGVWLCWDGTNWIADASGRAVRKASEAVAAFYKNKGATDWARICGKRRSVVDMQAMAQSLDDIYLSRDSLDVNPHLLGVANGVVDLRTGLLCADPRDELVTVHATVPYNPEATCPRWEKFIAEITGLPGDSRDEYVPRERLGRYVHKMLGYICTGLTREQKLFIATGAGSNGKSVLFAIFTKLLGEGAHCATVPAAFLVVASQTAGANNPAPMLMRLRNKRLALCPEFNEKQKFDTSVIKLHTGEPRLSGRDLHEKVSSFPLTHRIVVMSNGLPSLDNLDDATRGRLHLIPFERKWNRPGTSNYDAALPDADIGLENELWAEREGVLAWLVRGAKLYYDEGLTPPDEVILRTREYLDENDSMRQWLDMYEPCDDGTGLSAQVLFERYRRFLKETGRPPRITATLFGVALGRHHEKKRVTAGIVYFIRIKPEYRDTEGASNEERLVRDLGM